jgi:hypothetical protein
VWAVNHFRQCGAGGVYEYVLLPGPSLIHSQADHIVFGDVNISAWGLCEFLLLLMGRCPECEVSTLLDGTQEATALFLICVAHGLGA